MANHQDQIRINVEHLEGRIQTACQRARRNRSEVQLIAVSKTFSADLVRSAMAAGLRVFGENRVQEAATKFGELQTTYLQRKDVTAEGLSGARGHMDSPESGARLHLIGHLQSNKAKRAAEIFDMIQTVDRLEIAERLEHYCDQIDRLLPVLVQINLGNEETKSGVEPGAAPVLARQIAGFHHLRLRGLMAIPPFREDPEDSRADFRALSRLAHQIAEMHIPNVSMNELSMGMSHDFETAIEEGATMIRVGTAIFGRRMEAPDSAQSVV